MLSRSIVQQIERLLCESELTQEGIAKRLGVSRGIVNSIARGRRAVHSEGNDEAAARCRRCGHLVYMPCQICQTRKIT